MLVMLFITLLGVSSAGMAAMLLLKRYELNTGKVAFASIRPALGAGFTELARWLRYMLPTLARAQAQRAWAALLAFAHAAAARGVLRVEHLLERVLHAVREKTAPEHAGEASAFLREVADHKRALQRRRKQRLTAEE